MHDLNYQLKQLCDRNSDGSYLPQSRRPHTHFLKTSQARDPLYAALSDLLRSRWTVSLRD